MTAKTPFRELALDVCEKVDAKLVAMTGWYGNTSPETMAVWVFEELTELRLEMEQLVAWIENIKEIPR